MCGTMMIEITTYTTTTNERREVEEGLALGAAGDVKEFFRLAGTKTKIQYKKNVHIQNTFNPSVIQVLESRAYHRKCCT